jgi:hypothetical protein
MSGYRQGHEQGHDPYIDYAAQSESHPEERVFGSHPQDIQHGGAQGLNTLHEHLGQHQQHHQQHHHTQHQVFPDPHGMAHHQSPQFGGGQGMMYGARPMQQTAGTKRPRPEDLELDMGGLPEQQMQPSDMQGMPPQMAQQSMVGYGVQPVQTFHSHPLPNQAQLGKRARIGEPESSQMSMGAPSVVGMEGMPLPAPRPRGPKLKFTPEDDQLLVDLKENKSLTWKQIAEFFPGRSSGTLQVRYCTKLKAKTTQWTDETVSCDIFCLGSVLIYNQIQKLRTALHDYEQEKWRIIAQKVGTGFTSAACKEKAQEL